VWEAVIMANPQALARAMAECTKVLSLIARNLLGVPSAGRTHPDPAVEARRRGERAEQRLVPDGEGGGGEGEGGEGGGGGGGGRRPVGGGGVGQSLSEVRHLQDDALAVQLEAVRLMDSDDCHASRIRLMEELTRRRGGRAPGPAEGGGGGGGGGPEMLQPAEGEAAEGGFGEGGLEGMSARELEALHSRILVCQQRAGSMFALLAFVLPSHEVAVVRLIESLVFQERLAPAQQLINKVIECAPLQARAAAAEEAGLEPPTVRARACRGMYLPAGTVEQLRGHRDVIWEKMAELCPIDRAALARARERARAHGGGGGRQDPRRLGEPSPPVRVHSRFTQKRLERPVTHAEEVAYLEARVQVTDSACRPTHRHHRRRSIPRSHCCMHACMRGGGAVGPAPRAPRAHRGGGVVGRVTGSRWWLMVS
jgi:hypothetical protein